MSLTAGAIRAILEGETVPSPTLQVTDIHALQNGDRHRLILSDGQYSSQAILTKQFNNMVLDNTIKVGSTLQLSEYIVNNINGRNIIIVIRIDNVQQTAGIIGRPVTYGSGAAAAAAAPAPAPAPAKPAYGGSSYGAAGRSAGGYGGRGGYGGGGYGAVSRSGGPSGGVLPLISLNPYQNSFTIRVRVTSKSDMRTWSKPSGSGKLFSIDMLDENGTEMRGTFFNEEADKFCDMIQEGKVYQISNGRVKLANRRFTSIENEHELTFNRSTVIELVRDDVRISHVQYSFTPINKIEAMAVKSRVDVLGVVRSVREAAEINTRAGKQTTKRDLEIVDQTGTVIACTLWGTHATLPTHNFENHAIIALKGASVGDFNGRSLNTWASTKVSLNPDIEEAARLHTWLGAHKHELDGMASISVGGRGGGSSNDLSKRLTFGQVEERVPSIDDKGIYCTIRGTAIFVRNGNRNWYPACPNMKTDARGKPRTCNKRMVPEGDSFHCESCSKTGKPVYRYIMSCNMADHTGSRWVTLFDEAGKVLVGHDADYMARLAPADDAGEESSKVDEIMKKVQYKSFVLKARVRMDTYNDEARVKVGVSFMNPINYQQESSNLLAAIAKYN